MNLTISGRTSNWAKPHKLKYGRPGFDTAIVANPSTGLSQNAGSDADSVHISGQESDDVCTMYSVSSKICLLS